MWNTEAGNTALYTLPKTTLNDMEESCPTYTRRVTCALDQLQGKWTVQILCTMRLRSVRLSGIKRQIPSASKKALIASLRSLEAARIVLRRDLSGSLLHVEYEIVEVMREPLISLLDHLAEWGELYDSREEPRMPPSKVPQTREAP